MTKTRFCLALLLAAFLCEDLSAQVAQPSNYRGWNTLELSNGLIELQVAPEIGGRVIQLKLDDYEYLFVNDHLAGHSPPPTGVGPNGEWLNYGGEKLWPAPQGRGIPGKWDGPPDPILDGSPHAGRIVRANGDPATIGLVSQDDPRSGIRFSREIQLFADSTRVHIDATMTNIDTKPQRWGIWSVMQHNAANRSGPGHDRNMRVYCPLRRDSIYPKGYNITHGPADHSSFQPDDTGRMVVTHYERKMGKIGVDSDAGWVATVHGTAGCALVQRFPYYPDKEYPDQASVEIWLHGPYGPKAAQTDPKTFPYFLESELLSPFAQLAPGESYTFGYDWYAAAIGGDYPILDCTEAGVECEPLTAGVEKNRLMLKGRFGVFCRGTAKFVFRDANDKPIGQASFERTVSPLEPLVLADAIPLPPQKTRSVTLIVEDATGHHHEILASATLADNRTGKKPGARWSVERASQWYEKYPWICGCDYVPATAVNQLEMWQADTFDPKTIDRELGMAEAIGLNTVRIFLHDQAWAQDPDGFKNRLSAFLDICEKHHIWALITFFTNGGRGTPIKIGKQPEPIPGVHNSRWLQSPGSAVVNHPDKWAYLEDYVKDVLSAYAQDERVLCWCLYNEPESTRNGNRCLPLLRKIWQWGRQVDPSQPFTAPFFYLPMHPRTDFPICCFIGENCDIMSFHCYLEPEMVEKMIEMTNSFGRPVLCTEYIARPTNNFFNVTPLLKEANVGAIHFGLVNGKCNFQFYNPKELPEPKHWKHDIFRADGTPFDPQEIKQIKKLTGKKE